MFPGGPTLGCSTMRQRSFAILVAAVAFLLAGSVGVYAYESAHETKIADRVTAGSAVIGGLTPSAHRAKLPKGKGRKGRLVKGRTLRRDIEGALAVSGGDRTLPIRAVSIRPKVTTSQLAANYPTVITIDRPAFALALYKHLKRVKSYT